MESRDLKEKIHSRDFDFSKKPNSSEKKTIRFILPSIEFLKK